MKCKTAKRRFKSRKSLTKKHSTKRVYKGNNKCNCSRKSRKNMRGG
jgi:hypothetical protein